MGMGRSVGGTSDSQSVFTSSTLFFSIKMKVA